MSKTYESKVPCEYGHIGLRFTNSDGCVTCYKNKKSNIQEKKISDSRVASPIPAQKVGKPMPDIPPNKKAYEPLNKPESNMGVLLDAPYAVMTFVPNTLTPLITGELHSDENGFIKSVINGCEHPTIELGKKYSSYALLLPARVVLSDWDGEITDDGLLKLFKRDQKNISLNIEKYPFKMVIDDEDRPIWESFLLKDSVLSDMLMDMSDIQRHDFFNRFFVPAGYVQQQAWGGLFQTSGYINDVRWVRTAPVNTGIKHSDSFRCQAINPIRSESFIGLTDGDGSIADALLSILTAVRYMAIWDKLDDFSDKVLAVDYKKIKIGDILDIKKNDFTLRDDCIKTQKWGALVKMYFPDISKELIRHACEQKNIKISDFQLQSLWKQANDWLRSITCYPHSNVLLDYYKNNDIFPSKKKITFKKIQEPRGKIIDEKILQMVEHGSERAQSKHATPVWANMQKMEAIYALKAKGHQVDHIVPLNHPFVCGLHWEGNLEAIPAKANMAKGNKVWPDMPNYTGKDYAVLMSLKNSLHVVDYDISAVFRRWKEGKLRTAEWSFILDNSKAFAVYLNERTVFNHEETHRNMWNALNTMKPSLQTASLDVIKNMLELLHLDGPHMTWKDVNTFLLMIANRPDAWDILERSSLNMSFKKPYLDAKNYASFLSLQFRDVFFIKNAHFLTDKESLNDKSMQP